MNLLPRCIAVLTFVGSFCLPRAEATATFDFQGVITLNAVFSPGGVLQPVTVGDHFTGTFFDNTTSASVVLHSGSWSLHEGNVFPPSIFSPSEIQYATDGNGEFFTLQLLNASGHALTGQADDWTGGFFRLSFRDGEQLQSRVEGVDTAPVNATVPDTGSTLLLLGIGLAATARLRSGLASRRGGCQRR
jgi:hypothetical protein